MITLSHYQFNNQGNDYRFDTDKGLFYSIKFTDLHTNNPYKNDLIDVFLSQVDEYDKEE